MSLVINTNEQATRIHGTYNRNNTMMNAAMTRVATAQKINSARDGAANWAISEKMRERIRANDQANQNVQNDTALLKTAQGGIDNTIDILKTLKERAINAANDSNINTDRSAIATEVYQLVSQIDDNAAKVKFNGRTLLDGSLGSAGSTNSGVTVTSPKGDKAVYKFDALYKVASGTSANNATVADKLVDLTDSDGNKLFQLGDKVTLSWKANGETQTASVTVDDSKKLSDLSGLTVATSSAAKNSSGTAAYNTALSSGGYITGADNTTISDVSLSVTYTKADGSTAHRTEAESAISISGVQQSYGPKEGSNAVYAMTHASFEGTANAKLGDIKYDGSKYFNANNSAQDYSKVVYFSVGDKSIELNGNTTISEANAALANAGINYKIVTASTVGAEIEGVTRGSGEFSSTLTAEQKGLYFVATNGETRQLTVKNGGTAGSGSSGADQTLTEILKKASSNSTSSASASPLFDNGSGLTFHIGGEANFYMDMGIRSMTATSLLGNGASGFANMFTTKDSARNAISIIDNALQNALNEQTRLGAMESRLGYTSDNIITMNENLEAADSAYRDADIAKEMTNYMKYAVLSQSAQYMLAQAGQNGYQVLNLLNA